MKIRGQSFAHHTLMNFHVHSVQSELTNSVTRVGRSKNQHGTNGTYDAYSSDSFAIKASWPTSNVDLFLLGSRSFSNESLGVTRPGVLVVPVGNCSLVCTILGPQKRLRPPALVTVVFGALHAFVAKRSSAVCKALAVYE